jgi:hypothetical protein
MSTLAIMPHFEAVRWAWSISRLMAMSSSVARGGQRNSLISAVELLEGFTKSRAIFSGVPFTAARSDMPMCRHRLVVRPSLTVIRER